MLVALMKCRGKKAILTLHGAGLTDQLDRSDELRRGLAWPAIRFMMDHISFIVVVNPHVKELLVSIGINPNKVSVIPAFVAPMVRQEDIDEIPNDIWRFIEEHNQIISANASQIVLYKDEDLYGIDMCVDLCAMLKESYEDIGFVFVLPNVGNYEYFGEMQDRIKARGIGDNFLFVKQQYQFYPILMKSDLFVRPTITDGDSVSVRESLHFAVPVVASDAVQRPNGTILFENRNLGDFYEKVKDVLEHCQDYRKEAEETKLENHAEHLLRLYKKLGCIGSH
jgi:glycosyltransferase involved in cell wall biosynthesis